MRVLLPLVVLLLTPVGACSSSHSESTSPVATRAAPPPIDAGVSDRAEADAGPPREEVVVVPEPTFDDIAGVLFGAGADAAALRASCAPTLPRDARVRCLFEERYRGDVRAGHLANELFSRWQIVAGVDSPHTMDGGYRGMIRIEPALPLNDERKHIAWITEAFRDFDAFFAELERFAVAHATTTSSSTPTMPRKPRYRFKPLTLRFMRSVAARTPSAYAIDWTVAWNLAGSLNTSADAARETLFHEIFHLNDATRGGPGGASEWWSIDALGGAFDAIVRKCGTKTACLAPYSPNETIVRGGTYYSFQPGNGVREYAAELALRYYREQRAALRSLRSPSGGKPFKCGPPENAQAWALVRDEFFGGVDAVVGCS